MKYLIGILILVAVAMPAAGIVCPAGADVEGEPVLVDGYVDTHNPGCDGDGTFQTITTNDFCGVTGWYEVDGVLQRDTDWFTLTFPDADILYIRGQADQSTFLFVRATDCAEPVVLESVGLVSEEWRGLQYYGTAGATVWVWVAPPLNSQPDAPESWEYHLWFLAATPVDEPSWSSVKALFD